VAALGAWWLATVVWLAALAARTDVDYRYRIERQWERTKSLQVMRLGPGQSYRWTYTSPNPADRFSVLTFLEEATGAAAGQEVATVELKGDGAVLRDSLRAGVDTADFEIDRPESLARRSHAAPLDRVSFEWRVRDDSDRLYTARAYRKVLLPPRRSCETTLTVTSNLLRGTVDVVLATGREATIPPDPSRRRWIADRR
jgi:hypothetical protein